MILAISSGSAAFAATTCKGLAFNPSGTVLREFQWDAKNRLVKL